MKQYLELSEEHEEALRKGVGYILHGLGLTGPDYGETPERLSRALRELCAGIDADLETEVFDKGIFDVEQKEFRMPTLFKNISARGICPHHLLPILYKVDVEYKPRSKVVGLSRVHRLVRILAARPVLQEQLAYDIASALRDRLECPVRVRLEGLHMCIISRGSRAEIDSPIITELELD